MRGEPNSENLRLRHRTMSRSHTIELFAFCSILETSSIGEWKAPMPLLNDIIQSAVDGDVGIAIVLRKCRILAEELDNPVFKKWVIQELNGYDDHTGLPEYRVANVVSKGFFIGPMQAQINDQPLPASALDKEHRAWATTAYLMQGISSYEMLLNSTEDGVVYAEWPPDLVAKYQNSFFENNYVLNRAKQHIPLGAINGLVDTVRNRVLEFALELNREQDKGGIQVEELPERKVEQAVTNIIFGGPNVLAGHVVGDVQQNSNTVVTKGDFAALTRVLSDAGVTEGQIGALSSAIEKDGGDSLGEKTKEWLGKVSSSLQTGGKKIGSSVATATITKAICDYLGVGS